jgi:hypothetical protein
MTLTSLPSSNALGTDHLTCREVGVMVFCFVQKFFFGQNKDSSNDYSKNLILNKIKNLNGNNIIYLYKFLKQNENEMEYYLSHPYRNVRHILTKFRLSDHKLLIEIGRYLKIPRDRRLCAICNVLEDELIFFFECKRNTNNRNILYC